MTSDRSRRRLASEIALVAVVFVLAASAGWYYLTVFVGSPVHDYNNRTGVQFEPSAMWAMGQGLSVLNYGCDSVPGLKEFLSKEQPTWDSSQAPVKMEVSPASLDKFIRDRLYLYYLVGITWWMFGFSWAALNIPMALAYGFMAAVCYGTFRLGMNRLFSIACTTLSVSSPLLLYYLPSMRDFFRAPPILATIFLCGYLSSRRTSPRTFLLLALVTGLVIRIGMGFRQDAVICLPPATLTLVLLAQGRVAFPLRLRFLAVALLAGAAVFHPQREGDPADRSKGNNAFYLLQGFSSSSSLPLLAKPASYLPMYSSADYIDHAQIYTYADLAQDYGRLRCHRKWLRATVLVQGAATLPICPCLGTFSLLASLGIPDRDLTIWSDDAELVGRDMLWQLVKTFPADVLSRWYSTTVLVLRDDLSRTFAGSGLFESNPVLKTLCSVHAPIEAHMEHWGVCYAVLAALLLGAADIRLALVYIFLVLYFAGYPSLSFLARAAFHLQFVAFWAPGFLLSRLPAAVGWLRRQGFPHLANVRETARLASVSSSLKRIFVVCALVLPLILVPLYTSRLYQKQTVSRLVDTYLKADLVPLSWEERENPFSPPYPGCVLYCPKDIPEHGNSSRVALPGFMNHLGLLRGHCASIEAEYLVAELEIPTPSTFVRLQYQDPDANLDLWHNYPLREREGRGTYRYFFPVFDYTPEFRASHPDAKLSSFMGFEVAQGTQLKKLYRVRNKSDFPIMMNVWLPSDWAAFRWFLGVTPLSTLLEE